MSDDDELKIFELAGTDCEVEAFQYLKLLPKQIREHVSFSDFLTIKQIVTRAYNE